MSKQVHHFHPPHLLATTVHARDRHSMALIATKRSSRRLVFVIVCLLVALLRQNGAAQTAYVPAAANSQAHNIKTVFVIVMENHNWTGDKTQSIKNNKSAPYINGTLLPMSSHAENYFNPPKMHPSLPNYLWLEAGTNFGILADGSPLSYHQNTQQHLVTLLGKKGISWKDYDERSSGKVCPLQFWHNPFTFFNDVTGNNNPLSSNCIAHNRPFSELQRDLNAGNVASYNFIAPDLCNSMHNPCPHENGESAITEGDRWLASTVPAILNSSAYRSGGVLFIVWDEARVGDGPIPLLVFSPFAKGNGYSNNIHYTHGSLLRTIEEIFGTPLLGDAARQQDLSDLFSVFP